MKKEYAHTWKKELDDGMARERRGAESSVVSILEDNIIKIKDVKGV